MWNKLKEAALVVVNVRQEKYYIGRWLMGLNGTEKCLMIDFLGIHGMAFLLRVR